MIIAIDIGGTKTLIAGFDDKGSVSFEKRFSTSDDPDAFMTTALSILRDFNPEDVKAISIAAPGLVNSQDGVVEYLPNLRWENFALRKAFANHFSCPIYLENDANIAGVGATQALDNIPPLSLYITIGTGIGVGIITHGHINPALSHAEAGHMVFETDHGLQTWEQFASGRSITKQFGKLAAEIHDQADWQIIVDHLSVGLRVLIPALQPDIIILGGGIGTHFKRYESLLKETLQKHLREPKLIKLPPIIQAVNPEKAVIFGCYYHVLNTQITEATK